MKTLFKVLFIVMLVAAVAGAVWFSSSESKAKAGDALVAMVSEAASNAKAEAADKAVHAYDSGKAVVKARIGEIRQAAREK